MTANDILKSACGHLNPHLTTTHPAASNTSRKKKGCKTKEWMHRVIKAWATGHGFLFLQEYSFDAERKWRYDWAVMKDGKPLAAFEYEGIVADKSRHTTLTGYSGDTEKYNHATAAGWQVYRYTALTAERDLPNDLTKIKI